MRLFRLINRELTLAGVRVYVRRVGNIGWTQAVCYSKRDLPRRIPKSPGCLMNLNKMKWGGAQKEAEEAATLAETTEDGVVS